MPIQGCTLLAGATVAATGGTATTFNQDGSKVINGICVVDSAESDIRTQDKIIVKGTRGTLQTDGTWSKDRRSTKFVSPDPMPDGTLDFGFIEISYVGSPLRTTAQRAHMKVMAAQMLSDSDFAAFWENGNQG